MGWVTGAQFLASAMMGFFLFTTAYRLDMGPTQLPIQWVLGILALGEIWPGHEADHSPPSRAEVKNVWRYISTPPVHLQCDA